MHLNAQQIRFTQLNNSRIRLLAPAGSGKTLALLHRCLEISKRDTNVEFLLFSYTRAAVMELKNRINTDDIFASIRDITNVNTINAWGQNYIKEKMVSVRNPRLISDPTERKFAVLNSLQSLWGAQQQYDRFRVLLSCQKKVKHSQIILDLIDKIKNLGVRVDEFIKKEENYVEVWKKYLEWFEQIGLKDFVERGLFAEHISALELNKRKQAQTPEEAFAKNFLPFFCDAVELLKSMGLYTFEDQKYFPFLDLRKKNSEGEKTTRRRKLHIFVDEFQDSSPLDLRLFQELVKYENAELVIIGDDDQAIYQFRGATPAFILKPKTFFEADFETVIFETNYRSPKNIIEHSQQLIKHNKQREDKKITAANQANVRIDFLNELSNQNRAIFNVVTEKVLSCIASGQNVVLVGRRRGDLLPYEIIFGRQNQRFYVDTDLNVFDSDAYKKLAKLLRIKLSEKRYPSDVADVVDSVLKFPLQQAHRNELLRKLEETNDNAAMLNELYAFLALQRNKQKRLAEVIVQWFEEKNVADTLRIMAEEFVGFKKDFYRSDEDVFYADPPFSHLIDFAVEYGKDFNRFYEDLMKAATYGKRYSDGDFDETISINVMTAFRTKGREFDNVIILDANSDSWPNKQAKSEEEKETERRLFYVAVTRAKKELVFAGMGIQPTQYLDEMGLLNQ